MINIAGAPCCWGVDNPQNPFLPPWKRVLREASQAGYKGIELGPLGYIPLDAKLVSEELAKNDLSIVAGTIFDDLISESNFENLQRQVDDICGLITKLPLPPFRQEHKFAPPYLVIIDWGHDERDYAAGHPDKAPRLSPEQWDTMTGHIRALSEQARDKYGVRAVIHPHAGGYIEFADEIDSFTNDISYKTAGLCLDTGHLYYSKMDPLHWLEKYYPLLDYIHFKDINPDIYQSVMAERIRFFDACAKGVMCPIGEGLIPYEKIFSFLKQKDYGGFITIEQERDPRDAGSSLEDVGKSLSYLRSIGF